MLPGNPNIYTVTPDKSSLVAPFNYPDSIVTPDELTDYELGGVALQNPSQGLEYQVWKAYWDPLDSTAYIHPKENPDTPTALFVEHDVVELSFTFDQNMRWCAVTRKADNSVQFRWYDSAIENYTLSSYSGIASVRLCHDDKRGFQVQGNQSDIILTYVKASHVCWRIQRDRFGIEYTHSGLTVSATDRITHFGMNAKNRLQWRIGPRRLGI